MATLNYSLMVKDKTERLKTRKRQKINTILSFAGLMLAIAMLIVANAADENSQAVGIFAAVFLLLFGCCEGYSLYFHIRLVTILRGQELDKADPIQRDMQSIIDEYSRFFGFVKRLVFVLLAVCILMVVLFIILGATGAMDMVYATITVTIAVMLSIVVGAITVAVFQVRLSSRVAEFSTNVQAHFNEVDGLSEKEIKRQNNMLLNMSAAQKLLYYQFPNEDLRKKNSKSSMMILIPSVVGGIFLGLCISGVFSPIVTLLMTCLSIITVWVGIIVIILYQLKLKKEQRKLLEVDPQKNELFLKHADLTKAHTDKMNKVSLIVGIVVAVISWTLMIVGFIVSESTEHILTRVATLIGGMGFGSLVIWVIFNLPYLIIASVHYRKTVRPIEEQIDLADRQEKEKNKEVISDPFNVKAENEIKEQEQEPSDASDDNGTNK